MPKVQKTSGSKRLVLFLLAVIVFLSAALGFFTTRDQSRYVAAFRRIPEVTETGKTELTNEKERNVVATLERLAKKLVVFPWFLQVQEHALIEIEDVNNLKLTITAADGQYTIRPGWHEPEKRTLKGKIQTIHIARMEQILEDSIISDAELYEIASVVLIPALESLYNADAIYFPGDKRFLKLDNFMHVEVENLYDAKDRYGNPLKAQATVINADGQWLVFEGLKGDPDLKYTVNVSQMLEYYYLIHYKFRDITEGNLLQRKELLDEYMKLRESTVSYSRHQ